RRCTTTRPGSTTAACSRGCTSRCPARRRLSPVPRAGCRRPPPCHRTVTPSGICYESQRMYDIPVLTPRSPEEAAEAFGDGSDVTVLGGGTIVLPEIAYARVKPKRVLMLAGSGLDRLERANGTVTIGAAVRAVELLDGDEPLATAARYLGDPEVRAQATVGGNLCAPPGEAPRG